MMCTLLIIVVRISGITGFSENTVSNRLPWICCSFRAIYADAAVSRLFWHRHFNLTKNTYEGTDADLQMAQDLNDFDAFICGSDKSGIWIVLAVLFLPVLPFICA